MGRKKKKTKGAIEGERPCDGDTIIQVHRSEKRTTGISAGGKKYQEKAGERTTSLKTGDTTDIYLGKGGTFCEFHTKREGRV